MKIGILGGSFDPPHIGHYFVIKQTLELRKDIDKILLVPAFKHQWKSIEASTEDRLKMLKYFKNNKVGISDIEIKRKGISYSVDTVKEIKNKTKASLYWIAGSDILTEFDRWEKKEDLTKLTEFLIFPRDPYHLPQNLPDGFEVIQSKNLIVSSISSTAIRERVKTGRSIKYLVPKEIEEYIIKTKLYK